MNRLFIYAVNSYHLMFVPYHFLQHPHILLSACPRGAKTILFLMVSEAVKGTVANHWGRSVQSLSCVQLFATPWTIAHQPSLSISNSQCLFKLMSIESVMPSNHVIVCHPLLFLPSIFPSR